MSRIVGWTRRRQRVPAAAPFRTPNSSSKICVLVFQVGPKDTTRHRICSCIATRRPSHSLCAPSY